MRAVLIRGTVYVAWKNEGVDQVHSDIPPACYVVLAGESYIKSHKLSLLLSDCRRAAESVTSPSPDSALANYTRARMFLNENIARPFDALSFRRAKTNRTSHYRRVSQPTFFHGETSPARGRARPLSSRNVPPKSPRNSAGL